MELKEILAISGHGGLFKYISDGRNGIIVESFIDKKRTFVQASSKVSSLEDIAIYTETEEIPLRDILKKIADKENKNEAISHKSSADELKKYFIEIVPDYDRERVYVSDIKKVLQWYNILQKANMLDFEEKKDDENTKDAEKEEASGKTDKKSEATKSTKESKAPDSTKKPTQKKKPSAAEKSNKSTDK